MPFVLKASSQPTGQVLHTDLRQTLVSREEIRTQHDPLQLPHVARVLAFAEQRQCRIAELCRSLNTRLLRTALQCPVHKQRNLRPTLPDGRYPDRARPQPITEIFQ